MGRESEPRLLLVIIAASFRAQLVVRNFAAICAQWWAVSCSTYWDAAPPSLAARWAAFAPAQYLNLSMVPLPSRDCCATSHSNRFFCAKHIAGTLNAQARYLPALAHARASRLGRIRSGALQWAVLVDDNSIVDAPRLLGRLDAVDSDEPLYLGDFGAYTHFSQDQMPIDVARGDLWNGSAWDRQPPFACGGSGSVFSRAALLQMDVGGCARRYSPLCMQSDWMIGRCARDHGVVAVKDGHSCGMCGAMSLCPKRQQKAMITHMKLRELANSTCSFAHATRWCGRVNTRLRGVVCNALRGVAIAHGPVNQLCSDRTMTRPASTLLRAHNTSTTTNHRIMKGSKALLILWINAEPDGRGPRADAMRRDLARLALPHVALRVAAISTQEVDRLHRAGRLNSPGLRLQSQPVDVRSRDASFGPRASWEVRHTYSFGELSLSLSHLRAIAVAERRGEEHALIVEDDVRLGDLLGRWPQVEKLAASAPSDWQVLQLHIVNVQLLASFCASPAIYAAWEPHHWSTAAYLIRRSGMHAVLNATRGAAESPPDGVRLPERAVQSDRLIYTLARTYSFTRPLFTTRYTGGSTLQKEAVHTALDVPTNAFAELYFAGSDFACRALHFPDTRPRAADNELTIGALPPLARYRLMAAKCTGWTLKRLGAASKVATAHECARRCDSEQGARRLCDGFNVKRAADHRFSCRLVRGCGGLARPTSAGLECVGTQPCGYRRTPIS